MQQLAPSDCSDCLRSLQTVVGWSDMCVALLMPSIGGLRLWGCASWLQKLQLCTCLALLRLWSRSVRLVL